MLPDLLPAGLPTPPDTTLTYGDTTFELMHDDVPDWLAVPVIGADLVDNLPEPTPAEATQLLALLEESPDVTA